MDRLDIPKISISTPSSPEIRTRRFQDMKQSVQFAFFSRSVDHQQQGEEDAGAASAASATKEMEKLGISSLRPSHSAGLVSVHQEPAVVQTTFVIPSSFFKDFYECLQSSGSDGGRPKSNASGQNEASIVSWRRLMHSPLEPFLSGVRNKYPWIQLAGHKGSFLSGDAGTICKKSSELERAAFEALMEDALKPFVPLYYKEILISEAAGAPPEPFLEIQDLLGNFQNPSVMDVKMGVRTFLESEVTKSSKRMDLLQKMVELDPEEPTEEEKKTGITKLRYMSFRERLSSTKTMAFRIEGIKLANQESCTSFKTMKTRNEVKEVLMTFLPVATDPLHRVIRERLTRRLLDLHETLMQSKFFWEHELIGSSLLFIYDHTGRVGVWMIDFGKTSRVDMPITHRKPWELGNREDGYLNGLENLIDLLRV